MSRSEPLSTDLTLDAMVVAVLTGVPLEALTLASLSHPERMFVPMEKGHGVRFTAMRYVAERGRRGEFSRDTQRTVGSILGRFADQCGNVQISNINKGHVNKWWASLAVGPSSARNQLSTVKTFLRWCIEHDLLRADPSRHVRPPREPRRVPRTVQAPVAATLVAGLPDARARFIVLWMLHLGLRAGEIARLEIGDVDFDARLVLIRGKGGNERMLPIPTEAWFALETYLSEYPGTSGPLVRRYDDPHRGLTAHYVSDLVRVWMRDLGVKRASRDGISGHALRRTCASDLLDGGAHIRQVQQVLGHASIATTEKYLRRSDAKDLRGVMDGRTYKRDNPN